MDEHEPAPDGEGRLVIEFPDDPEVPVLPDLGALGISVEAEQPSDEHWEIADLGIPRDQG